MSTPAPPQLPKLPTHLTVIKNRNPEQKAHKTLGHAKQAVLTRMWYDYSLPRIDKVEGKYPMPPKVLETDVLVYELKDGEWSLLWDLKEGTLKSELPWKTV